MLEPNKVLQEMKALQRHFRDKRDYVLRRLKEIGFEIKLVPDSTFYIWLDLRGLPEEINDGLNFFQQCLEEKVIGECMHPSRSINVACLRSWIDMCVVVPGIFFDLNPAKRRDLFDSPCHHFVRLSYGPRMETLEAGLAGIERVVKRYPYSMSFDLRSHC